MSKDEAMGRLVRLAEQCDERSIRRLCNEVEESLEIGPYGVCTWTEPRKAQRMEAPSAPSDDLEIGTPAEPSKLDPAAWEVVAACSTG
jgi:hypothetical protein